MKLNSALSRLPLLLMCMLSNSASIAQEENNFSWLAGDHHIHSRNSVGWDQQYDPPAPVRGGDAIYPIHMNALMGKYFGLSWIVSTDHGGPNHSKVNLQWAYPELLQSRQVVPEVIQFWGMEFDTPGADHSSLIIPFTEDEAEKLFELESSYSRREPWPADPSWDSEAKMLEALQSMRELSPPPLLIANHPARSARGLGIYGRDDPAELRAWNNTAPGVAVGMAGAPGHQAAGLMPDGSLDTEGARGGYRGYPTIGGFDQLTARIGGFWDSMIGEGRDWWITANSDSHVHYSEGGADFWPGEYSKTYVWAEKSHASVMDGIRHGRVFVTTGDLVDQLFVSATAEASAKHGDIGDSITIERGDTVNINIRFNDPDTPNNGGIYPSVKRVDLILGSIRGKSSNPLIDKNETARVITRFDQSNWEENGTLREIDFQLENLQADSYIRVRGTAGDELEPEPDIQGEDPWQDLWFYGNPIKIYIEEE